MVINWYPGHMAKARRLIEDSVKLVDVVIELLDARIPVSSANPMISKLIGNKPSLVVLNKSDLADPVVVAEWVAYYQAQGRIVIALNGKDNKSIKQLIHAACKLAAPKLEHWKARGLKTRSVRIMILGIPNVGKSTLINTLSRSSMTKTANRPGETKGKQWVRIANQMDLLDTPGVLWPKLENQISAYRLAATGAIPDTVFDMEEVVTKLTAELGRHYQDAFCRRFKLDGLSETPQQTIEAIGRKRGCIIAGNTVDLEKTRKLILKEYREGKIGAISLDRVDEFVSMGGA